MNDKEIINRMVTVFELGDMKLEIKIVDGTKSQLLKLLNRLNKANDPPNTNYQKGLDEGIWKGTAIGILFCLSIFILYGWIS